MQSLKIPNCTERQEDDDDDCSSFLFPLRQLSTVDHYGNESFYSIIILRHANDKAFIINWT